MKNIIKNVPFLFVAISFLSCSEDDNTTSAEESFFNLNVGNKWVYKKYENSNFNPTEFTFNGVVDTIKIIDEVTISGLTFAKKLTKRVNINSNAIVYEKITYVRMNNQGHLVEINEDTAQNTVQESFGFVLHPGSDFNYIYVVAACRRRRRHCCRRRPRRPRRCHCRCPGCRYRRDLHRRRRSRSCLCAPPCPSLLSSLPPLPWPLLLLPPPLSPPPQSPDGRHPPAFSGEVA